VTVQRPPEALTARCEGCDRTWQANGTLQARDALKRAQKHANRTGHRIDIDHHNPR